MTDASSTTVRGVHLVVERAGPAPRHEAHRVVSYEGTGPVPVVVVSTWDSESAGLHRLAGRLGPTQALHVVTHPVVVEDRTGPRDVAAWVADVRDALSVLDLSGPVVLAGWSFGGVVAAGLAQALVEEGDPLRPAEVVLIDSRRPSRRPRTAAPPTVGGRVLRHGRVLVTRRPSAGIVHLRAGLRRMAKRRQRRRPAPVTAPPEPMSPLRRCIKGAWVRYEGQEITVPGTLLWCDESLRATGSERLQWDGWWTGPLATRRIEGTHRTVYEGPAMDVLVDAVAAAVVRAGAAPAGRPPAGPAY